MLVRRVRSLRPGWATVEGERFLLRYPYSRFQAGPEATLLGRFAGLVAPGMLVFDIGANAGVYALVAARAGARVVAFEPSAAAADLVREHLRLNRLTAVVEEAVVAGAEQDAVTFFEQGAANTSSLSEASARTGLGLAPGTVRAVERPATTIDAAVRAHGAPDLIKLDVEGAEKLALEGASDWLAALSGILLLEVHPWSLEQLGTSANETLEVLVGAGWSPELLDDNGNTRHYVCRPATP